MGDFKPKAVLKAAESAESTGDRKVASQNYAMLSSYFRKAGKFSEARTMIKRALKLVPRSPRLMLAYVVNEASAGNIEKATNAMKKLSALAVQKNKAESLRAHVESQLTSFPTLRQIFFDSILKLDRTSAVPFVEKAKALLAQGNWNVAKAVLIEALQTKDRTDEVIALLRQALKSRGEKDLIEYLERFRDGKLEREDLISLLSHVGDKAASIANVDFSEQEERTLGDLIRELEKNIGVRPEDEIDSVIPLVKEFRDRAKKITKGDAKAKIDMATAFFEMGLNEDAMDELKAIPSSDPLYPIGRCLWADILISTGSELGALDALQEIIRYEAVSKEVRWEAIYKLIQVYLRLGDIRSGLENIRILERESPNYRDLKSLKTQLELKRA